MYNWSTNKQHTHSNKGVSVANSIHHSKHIYNYLKALNLGLFLSDVYLNHLLTIILSVFLRGYRGKTVDFQEVSHCHRTTTAYFLNHGKWKDDALQDVLKSTAFRTTDLLYCGWYDCFTYPAFVTGGSSNRSCVFSSITFKRLSGLWASGCLRYAFLQRDYPELCSHPVR